MFARLLTNFYFKNLPLIGYGKEYGAFDFIQIVLEGLWWTNEIDLAREGLTSSSSYLPDTWEALSAKYSHARNFVYV